MKVICILMLVVPFITIGQEIVYYNSSGKCDKEEAEFYHKVFEKNEQNLIPVEHWDADPHYKLEDRLYSEYSEIGEDRVREGIQIKYNDSGKVISKVFYVAGEKDGVSTGYYSNGDTNWINYHSNGLRVKKWKSYHENGKIHYVKTFVNDTLHGELIGYYESGIIRRKEMFSMGDTTLARCFGIDGTDTTYFPYEEIAMFRGGLSEMYQFLAENMVYPKYCRRNEIEGKVYIKFAVLTDGSLDKIKVLRSPHEKLSEEVERVVRKMPKWEPGRVDGEIVDSYFTLPVKFKLD
jgi:TonB family protein